MGGSPDAAEMKDEAGGVKRQASRLTRMAALDRGVLLPNAPSGPRVLDRAALLRAAEVPAGGGEPQLNVSEMRPEEAVDPSARFVSNRVVTSRYTVLNFLPKNLYEQFQNYTNIYFLFVGVLQIIPSISTTEGFPSIYLPLGFVLAVSALRAAVEDHTRHKEDREENGRAYAVLRPGAPAGARRGADADAGGAPGVAFRMLPSEEIRVGDIVRVPANSQFPADLVFLHSSNRPGHCFVETSNIDGETNLKVKVAPHELHERFQVPGAPAAGGPEDTPDELLRRLEEFEGVMMFERPSGKLAQFNGWVGYQPAGSSQREVVRLEAANLLLRGTRLQNTQHVLGLAVYTGDDSKVRRNASKQRNLIKIKSSMIGRVDRYLLGMLALQCFLCLIGAVLAGEWHSRNKGDAWYLDLSDSALYEATLRFFTWFIILSQFVPISLLVTGEFVKTFQTFFMNRDVTMFSNATNKRASVRTLQLNEDLGQVEYIFSDKTGTLTCNVMDFRVAVVRGRSYGNAETEIAKRVKARLDPEYGGREARRPWSELEAEAREREEALHDVKYAPPLWKQEEKRKAAARSGGGGGGGGGAGAAGNAAVERNADSAAGAAPPARQLTAAQLDAVASHHPFVNFSLEDRDRMLEVLWGDDEERAEERRWLRLLCTHLAISNTITPVLEEGTGETSLQASSPDELALCSFAQFCGFSFVKKNPVTVEVDSMGHGDGSASTEEYEFLANLDFNSKRKRATAIYARDGRVLVMCKGADSVMFDLFREGTTTTAAQMDELTAELDVLSTNGLRTLVLGHAERDPAWWEDLRGEYEFVSSLPERDDEANHTRGACSERCRICACYNRIELAADLEMLGSTAIDDGLQALVPEAIEDFLCAGIKVWMLTGDKLQTAKNIGMACNLIDPGTELADPARWRDNRLLPITAQLADLHRLEGDELRQYFDGVFAQAAAGTGTYEEQVVAFLEELQLDVSPSAEDDDPERLTQVPRSAVADAFTGAGLEPGRLEGCTFEHFERVMRLLEITAAQAVAADLRRGHTVMARHQVETAGNRRQSAFSSPMARVRAGAECSLVVEGRALSVLYPQALGTVKLAVDESKLSKQQKKKKGKKKKKEATAAAAMAAAKTVSGQTSAVEMAQAPPASSQIVDAGGAGGTAPAAALGSHSLLPGMSENEKAETLDMQDQFFDLASACKSVIACRLTPYQKAQIIADVQNRKDALTLAIGDGANDEPMIHTAHVGVGIQGLEGSAAANASDYAIGQFRYLHTLLFVHGYWSYNRLSKMVVYIFYKTIMMRLCMYFFGAHSGWSGEQFYNEFVALFYNVAMTAVPIMVLSTLDKRLSRRTLVNSPEAYASLRGGAIFKGKFFAGWILRAIIDAVVIFYVGYGALGVNDVGQSDGRVHGRWVTSTTMYFTTVSVATFRIVLEFNTITWIHQFFIWLSFFGSYAVIYAMTELQDLAPALFGVMARSAGTPAAWLSLLLTVTVSLLLGIGWYGYHREMNPEVSDVLQEKEHGFGPPEQLKGIEVIRQRGRAPL